MLNNRTKKRVWTLVLPVLILTLATLACGDSGSAEQGKPQTEVATPAGELSSTVEPTPEPVDTFGCDLNAVFEADVTIPDNARVEGGQSFTKTWRIRNAGTCAWVSGYRLTFVDGDQMGGPDSVVVPETSVGESAQVSVELVAPQDGGQYRGSWQICVNETECFGDRIYIQIVSTEPTSIQTPTPATVLEWEGVYIGMPADDVLKIHPKSETTEEPAQLGTDSDGLIFRWSYPDAYLIFARREGEGTDSLGMSKCYRVVEIQLR